MTWPTVLSGGTVRHMDTSAVIDRDDRDNLEAPQPFPITKDGSSKVFEGKNTGVQSLVAKNRHRSDTH